MTATSPPLIPIEVFEIAERDEDRYTEKAYVGDYLYCKPTWCWNVPAQMVFKVSGDHPLCQTFAYARDRVIPVRATVRGREWTGRVMDVEIDGDGRGNEIWTVYCMSNLFWLMVILAWVNPNLPAEVQIGLTGKQDIMFGPLDWVFKWFLARNSIRANIPVYCKMPVRFNNPGLPTLNQLLNLDQLLTYADGLDVVALSARFPKLIDLYKQTVDNAEIGMTMDLVIPAEYNAAGKPMPFIFNTQSLATLQSIIDYTSDNFLNVTKLSAVQNLWNPLPTEPCYVFHTIEKRDRRHMVFQLRGGYVEGYQRKISHARASHVIVGGRAPAALNALIEFAANLAVQAIAGLFTTAFGLPGVGALAVGDLFDNIFFAFQHFYDGDLQRTLGRDGFKEDFKDNTAAWSLDAFATGLAALRANAGDDTLSYKMISGFDDDSFEFGADTEVVNGQVIDYSHKRFQEGDIVSFYHLGTVVENYISEVSVEDQRTGRLVQDVQFGSGKQKDAIASIFDKLGGFASISQAVAVSS